MKNLSLSSKILLGVFLGIFFGFFFGESVQWLSIGGDIFIGLLQMTVLPYIMFSLIVNIGRLSLDSGKRIVKNGLKFLLLLLFIGLLGLLLLPVAFPQWGSGSFYSTDFLQGHPPFDVVKLYIPANPFESMSNNVVPAVVLFSIFIGLGVMNLPDKETMLKPLDILCTALNQVNKMIVKITPIGVFCIAAGVVSTLSWADLSRLQGYLLIYLLAVLLLTFLVLPYLISIFTPYSPKTVFKLTRSTLITIFATGKIIVVYPQLIENIKEILREEGEGASEKVQSEVDVIMPLAYPFPNLGTFMIFIFVPFAAWYSGQELLLGDYPVFLSSTLLSSFVAPITGLPFSLDLMDIPQETFQLFVVSSVLTDRIRVVLGAFHLITLTLLTIAASHGFIRFRVRKLIEGIIVVGITGTVLILGMNILLKKNLENIPTNEDLLNKFSLISPKQPYELLETPRQNPNRLRRGENTLSRIKRRQKLRVGFYPNSLPFAFLNKDSMLVGFGIDLAHQLATELNASLEFIPIKSGQLIEQLDQDYYDIVMSDIFISSRYAEEMELSKPYMNVSLALLVPKNNKDFDDFNRTIKLDTFTIAYFERSEIADEFISYFPHAGSYPVETLEEFFDQKNDTIHLDAYLTSAERAAAFTVIYPEYKLSNPLPYHIENALVFPMARDEVWRRYVDNWIDYRTQDGTFQRLYDQWILGREFKQKEKPWSILDNVIKPKWQAKVVEQDSLK